jgi:hypothetical protein
MPWHWEHRDTPSQPEFNRGAREYPRLVEALKVIGHGIQASNGTYSTTKALKVDDTESGGSPPGDCASCDQVDCGGCQEGCEPSSNGCDPSQTGASSRNGCPNKNKGCHPAGCTIPAPPAPPLPPGGSLCGAAGWRQVWSDEFSG